MFKREKEMRPIVARWLKERGYYVAHEVLVGDSWCDIVGCKWAERVGRRIPPMIEAVAVELKVNDVAGVLHQAEANYTYGRVSNSYVAMPAERVAKMKRATIDLFEEMCFGLLMISADGVEIVVEASEQPGISKDLARRLWSYKLRDERAKRRE